MSEMLTGPKKIVDGLTEVFRGLTRMCEGMAEQIELLEFTSEDAEDEEMLSMPSATQNWQTPSFCRHSRIIGKHCSSWCRSRRNGNTGPAKRNWSDSSTRSGIGL